MAEAPGQPVLDDVTDAAAAGGDAGDRRDVIGLERMLHAQQKPKPQNCKHTRPISLSRRIKYRTQAFVRSFFSGRVFFTRTESHPAGFAQRTSSNRAFIAAHERRSDWA